MPLGGFKDLVTPRCSKAPGQLAHTLHFPWKWFVLLHSQIFHLHYHKQKNPQRLSWLSKTRDNLAGSKYLSSGGGWLAREAPGRWLELTAFTENISPPKTPWGLPWWKHEQLLPPKLVHNKKKNEKTLPKDASSLSSITFYSYFNWVF